MIYTLCEIATLTKGQAAKNFFKKHQVKAATKVSSHWLGLKSSLRSSHRTSGKQFYHEAIFEQVHSKLNGKHLFLEQVVGIALPASLKGLQAVSASSISLQVEWKRGWCPNLEHLSRLQIPPISSHGIASAKGKTMSSAIIIGIQPNITASTNLGLHGA